MTILALVLAMTFVLAACDGTPDDGTCTKHVDKTTTASAITAAKQ